MSTVLQKGYPMTAAALPEPEKKSRSMDSKKPSAASCSLIDDAMAEGGGRKRVEIKTAEILSSSASTSPSLSSASEDEAVCGRERLKRHRIEMAGRVWIPETWGQETLLNGWTDCTAFDRSLFPAGLMAAREGLVEECRRANAGRIRIGNSC